MPAETVSSLLVAAGYVGLGVLLHEVGHYAFGALFGGGPSFRGSWFGLPTYVEFEAPGEMAGWQVRITAGVPIVFLFVCGIGLFLRSPRLILFGLGGGATISALDYLAVWHPGGWKGLAAEESITVDDLEPPSLIRWLKHLR